MQDKAVIINCPLCGETTAAPWFRTDLRHWLRCATCDLVFVPRRFHLDPVAERQRYDSHDNRPDDPAYRAFLAGLFEPLRVRLSPGAVGLDFGSGPGPTLSLMFEEAGFPMTLWDPYYAPDHAALARRYDFVSCSETVEHFADPATDWSRLVALVRPGGWLGIMTGLLEPDIDFAQWHYKNDPTHVCFYSMRCITWIAGHYGLRVEPVSTTVVLLQVPRHTP